MGQKSTRRHRTVHLDYMAHVVSMAGKPICDCALIEISETGARIAVLASGIVPDEFNLMLSTTGLVRRICKVEWRTDDEIGVSFQKHKKSSLKKVEREDFPCP